MITADALINEYTTAGIDARKKFFSQSAEILKNAAFATALQFARMNKLLICGNGGSAADAQHLAGEFVNRFLIERPALPAIALTTDTSVITAISNDYSFERVFARQIEALGQPGDVLLAISTSGNSSNILEAVLAARHKNMLVIGLCGQGGQLADKCDYLLAVPSSQTPIIQEIHLAIEHLFCRLCDYFLFENPKQLAATLASKEQQE